MHNSVGQDITRFLQARGACASFVSGFVTFMSIGGFPSFIEDMKVKKLVCTHYVLATIKTRT
jgi:hypothetical protein